MSSPSPTRRGTRWRDRVASASPATLVASALVLGFVAVTIGPALLGRGVLLDVGILTRMMPWRADGIQEGGNWCRGDTVDAVLPQLAEIRRGLRRGDIATWSSTTAGGSPLASLPNSAIFSPAMWPYLVLPLWLAPAFVKLTQFAVAIVGMVAFLGRLGVRRAPALVAGILFVSSGFMMMWSNWQHVVVGCLIPALFWALDRAVVERRPRDVAVLALIFASMLLGGFPAVTLYALCVGAVLVVARALAIGAAGSWRPVLSAALCTGAGLLLGAALAAFQLLPFVRDLGALGLAERDTKGPLPFGHLLTVVAPDVHGDCTEMAYGGLVNPIEGIGFVGVAALVLAVCAVAVRLPGPRPRLPILLALTCALAGLLVWVGGVPLRLLQELPGFSSNSIGRASSVFGFLVAVLAGVGLDRLLRRAGGPGSPPPTGRSPRGVVLPVLLALGVLIVLALAWRSARDLAATGGRLDEFDRALVWPAVVLGVALAGIAATYLLRGRWRLIGPLVVAVAAVAQSTVFAHQVMPSGQREDFYPVTPAHRFLTEHLGTDRYAGRLGWGYAPTSMLYDLNTPYGHAFHAPAWMDLLQAIAPESALGLTFSIFPGAVETADVGDLPILDQLGVRYFAASPSDVVGTVVDPVPPPAPSVPVGDEPTRCTVPGGPVRGVEVIVARDQPPTAGRTPRLHARLTTPSGTVLEGTRALEEDLTRGLPLRVGLLGEDLPASGPHQVEVWLTGLDEPVPMTATDAGLACAPVRPARDGLRLVHTDAGSVIYERETALPRIRWAGTSEVVADEARRIRRLQRGIDPDTVLLSSGGTPPASGSTAEVDVRRDDPERIEVQVDSDGAGYLVVADSIARAGWSAMVDGRPVEIVPGNHALAAVPVGEGRHRVVLTYTAPGLRTGAYVSAGALAVTAGLLFAPLVRRRRRLDPRTGAVESPDTPTPEGHPQ